MASTNQYLKKFKKFYWILLIPIILNEFTLSIFDSDPPISQSTLTKIRFFDIFIFCFFILIITVNIKNFFKIKNLISWFFFYLSIIIILDISLKILGFGYIKHYREENIERFPSPYDMFSGKPNVYDHNDYGFRGTFLETKKIPTDTFTLAFFGGSTGYLGSPPIPNQIKNKLSAKGIKLETYNFSSVSSNHSQHLHRLIKFIKLFKFDIVLFYGGFNETIQYSSYDPRPGYPYNFFYRNELPSLNKFLVENSSIIGEIDKRNNYFIKLNELRHKIIDDEWEQKIINRYKDDLTLAREITVYLGKPKICSNPSFISIRQPANPNSIKGNSLWKLLDDQSLKLQKNENIFHFDISKTPNLKFVDIIHIDQESKEIVAEKLTAIVHNVLKKC